MLASPSCCREATRFATAQPRPLYFPPLIARRSNSSSSRMATPTAAPHGMPLVGVIMGSSSDLKYLQPAIDLLAELGVPHEAKVVSAHRTPDWMFEYASTAESRGIEVIIAAAGGAAHLPGMVAAKTMLPVLGVPVPATLLNGLDSLLSIVQMPKGVPVGTLAIGEPGAVNAALLATSIVSTQRDQSCASGCAPGAQRAPTTCSPTPTSRRRTDGADSSRRDDRHSRRRTARSHDRDGRALARLQRPRARPRRELRGRAGRRSRRRREVRRRGRRGATSRRNCDVITLEIEQIGVDALAAAQRHAPVRPSPSTISRRAGSRACRSAGSTDERLSDRRVSRSRDAPRSSSTRASATRPALREGVPRRLRRSQPGARRNASPTSSTRGSRSADCASVAEQALELDVELSVMVARRPSGEVRVYPPALNHHERQILAWSVLPAPLPAAVLRAGGRDRARNRRALSARGHSRRRDVPAARTARCS